MNDTDPVAVRPRLRSQLETAVLNGTCTNMDNVGDCEHAVGLPGKSIPGQHDGDDDRVDVYGKPNGWCWSCWRSQKISNLHGQLRGE